MTGLAPILNNYRYLIVVIKQFDWVPAGNGSGLHSHRMTYDWQQLACTREKNTYTILRFKQGFDRRLSTIGKSLRFTIPHSKANNKSKSV